jgi:serine/threonine-protein kinase
MSKLGFWKSDGFLGVALAIAMFVAAYGDLVQSLERKAYDLGVRAASRVPSDKIAVIAIDEQSIANIGRWPWPRDVHARMTDIIAGANAKVIANGTFFFEPQLDPGLLYINKLLDTYAKSAAEPSAVNVVLGAASPAAPNVSPDLVRLGALLAEAEQALNTDRKLADSFKRAGNVLLPMMFQHFTEPQGNPDKSLPDYLLKSSVSAKSAPDDALPLSGLLPLYPIAELGAQVRAIGHLNAWNDVDGAVRTEPLFIRHYDRYFPSLSVMIAAQSLNLKATDVKPSFGEAVQVGKLRIRTDPALRMYTFFYSDHDNRPAFPIDSFFDVYSGKIPAAKYRDKIVLIGPTAAGLGSYQVTPISPATPPVLTMAHSVSSILGEHFFVVPTWGVWVEKGVFLLVALYIILLLPRLKANLAAMVTAAVFVVLLAAHFVLITTQLMWLQFMTAITLLLIGHLALTTKRFLVTEKGKERSDVDLAQSHRMLGLGYQGQGQLDTAFDYFRKLALDDGMMEVLYNLGLDYERKRQFNKAESVFRYMAEHNPRFRDLESRLTRAQAMSETVILGGAQSHPGGTLMLSGGGVEKPILGSLPR